MKITLLTGKTFNFSEALGFEIKVKKSAIARKLTLRIDAKDRIPALTIPRFCTNKRAVEFVRSNQEWIFKHLDKLPEITFFKNGDQITLFGKSITIVHNPKARQGEVIKDNILYVSGDVAFLHRRVTDFIKKLAKKEFYEKSKIQAQIINRKLNGVFIKDTKSRWGSCSSIGNINYNWRLALAPEHVINYMVAHEVSHLKHQDHSNAFWKCVEKLCPTHKEGRAWLRSQGKDLYNYQ